MKIWSGLVCLILLMLLAACAASAPDQTAQSDQPPVSDNPVVLVPQGEPTTAPTYVPTQAATNTPTASTNTPEPTPTPTCDEQGLAYRRYLEPLVREWATAVQAAQPLFGDELSQHMPHLQELRQAFGAATVPDCWQTAHQHLLAMADAGIQGFLARQAGQPAVVANEFFQRANRHLEAFVQEEAAIIDDATELITPTAEPIATATPEPAPSSATPEPGQPSGQVMEVIDGDTITVLLDGVVSTVRLIGVDTPETKHPSKPVECFGYEAARKVQELLAGQTVTLAVDPSQGERDKYDRLLRYVWLPDGRMVNLELIAQGYAYEYTYDLPYEHQAEFKQAQQQADVQDLGLWAAGTCNGERVVVQPTPEPVPAEPAQPVEPAPVAPAPPATNCDPSYPDVCIPPSPPDLNCPDIQYSNFRVLSPDPHRFDGDKDGIGCQE